MTQRQKLSLGLSLIAAVVASAGFGPLVRARAAAGAARYGAVLQVRRVWPSFGGVVLRDVEVDVPELSAVRVKFDAVEVSLGLGLRPRRVSVRGGTITVTGRATDVLQSWQAFREAHRPAGPAAGSGGDAGREVALHVRDLGVLWTGVFGDSAPLAIGGATVDWQGRSGKVAAHAVSGAEGPVHFAVADSSVVFVEEGGRSLIQAVKAENLDLTVELPTREKPAPARPASSKAVGFALARVVNPGGPPLGRALTGALSLRDPLIDVAARATSGLTADGTLLVNGVHVLLSHGDQRLNVGPGVLRARREGERLELNLEPGAPGTASPLTLHASLPTKPDTIAFDINGGPTTLASLGIHENDFGLTDTGRATLSTRARFELSADAERALFDGDGQLHSVSITHPALADEPVRGIEVGWRLKGSLDVGNARLTVDDGELALGALRLQLGGAAERGLDFLKVDGHLAVPVAACQSMLDSVPRELVPRLAGIRMEGVFSLTSSLSLDTRRPDDVAIDWRALNRCRVTDVPADVSVAHFKRPFRRWVYDAEGHKAEILSGPGTPTWIPLESISPLMEAAVTTTEDVGFRHHDGFDRVAIKNSIRDDLKAGKFLRGASTISMQLAKNLYLEREKSFSRKLQEAVLTSYLEQELTKDEIMELYLNSVEFGPMLYGVGPAADYYFDTSATELSLGQALFLASILPSPKRTYFAAGGQIAPGWLGYLHKLMKIMRDRNRITPEDLAEGLSEAPTFHVARSPHVRRQGEVLGDPEDGPPAVEGP